MGLETIRRKAIGQKPVWPITTDLYTPFEIFFFIDNKRLTHYLPELNA